MSIVRNRNLAALLPVVLAVACAGPSLAAGPAGCSEAGSVAAAAAAATGNAKAKAKAKAKTKGKTESPVASHHPLGSHPASIRYLSNDAPFVVSDVAPRCLAGALDTGLAVSLDFAATDMLNRVDVFAYAVDPSGRIVSEAATPIRCGSRTAGSHRCRVPAGEFAALLESGRGTLGLRIEAEGVDRDRSSVRVLLPVLLEGSRSRASPARARPAPTPPIAPPPAPTLPTPLPGSLPMLTFVSD
ncbi:conserved exported hypothetical protein [Burkholderiales bacterium 8X]|nr:conserved exported hypothetical protein [Burkholderiales bacterium 8X]